MVDGQAVVSEGGQQRSEGADHGAPVGLIVENRLYGFPGFHDQALNPGNRT